MYININIKNYIIIEWLTFGEYACLILSISFSNILICLCILYLLDHLMLHTRSVCLDGKSARSTWLPNVIFRKQRRKLQLLIKWRVCVCIHLFYLYEYGYVCVCASVYLVQGFITFPPFCSLFCSP